MTTVLIADDSAVTRRGVRAALDSVGVQVVGEATDSESAAHHTATLRPDIVLLEVRLPKNDGFWALKKIKDESPDTRVVMYSVYDNPNYVAQAVALGADNYLSKDCSLDDLRRAIEEAVNGVDPNGASLMPAVKDVMYNQQRDGDALPLTRREHQVLRLVSLGLSNRLIATCLNISTETVKEHVQNMLRKLGMRDRTEAAVFAARRGLV